MEKSRNTNKVDWCIKMLENRCAPETITELNQNQVFVFGSKPNGNHKGGAAKLAVEKFGAIEGQCEGLAGQSYAVPVHTHRIHEMDEAVKVFVSFSKKNPNKQFIVLPIGCGSAGMDVRRVAEMFSVAIPVSNILLPQSFINALIQNRKQGCELFYTDYPDYITLINLWTQRLKNLIKKAESQTDIPTVLGRLKVNMNCSITDAVNIIVQMCLPTLRHLYPEFKHRSEMPEMEFWFKPNMSYISLAINQLTEGWTQCINYNLNYYWYAPQLRKEDIIECLQYPLKLYGPYFDGYID